LKQPEELLRHILDECDFVIEMSAGMDIEDFLCDETMKRAFARSIEIIGEAAKQVPDDYKRKNPHVEWKEMAGMRDILIHSYHKIDHLILWDVVQNIHPLREKIYDLLER